MNHRINATLIFYNINCNISNMRFKVLSIILLFLATHVKAQNMSLKRIILFLYVCTHISVYNVSAQSNYVAVDVIKQFSQILTEYGQTKDLGVCGPKFDNLCHERVKCRVESDFMKRIADISHSVPKTDGTYLFDTYINEISKMVDNGCQITIENIEYDLEMSKLGLVEGKADYVKYDMIVSENLSTENRYTDLAIIRDGKLTSIYQYSGARAFAGTIKMLLPNIVMENFYNVPWMLNLSKAEEALYQFRKIAANSYGDIAIKSMAMVVAMEMEDIGCSQIGKYAKMMDMANYFVHYTSCPAIEKLDSKRYLLDGIKSFEYIIGPGETMATWNLYKRHPYINDKGSAYFHYVLPKYRPLSNVNLPYVKKDGENYGFVSEKDKIIVACKYSFVYPFDHQSNLAAVRDKNNKWGFINKYGELVIPHIYDAVNDIFVDGKNFVIDDDYLILIDKNGQELRRIYGYNYIIPKLKENEIIAYNGIKQQFDAYDFYGNLLIEDCFSKTNMSKKEYVRFRYYYIMWGEFTYNQKDDISEHVFYPPRIPIKISLSEISSEEAVDLGIGSLWSSKNLEASSCSDMGKLYLWGDYKSEFANIKRTRENGEKFKKKLLKNGVPLNIAGTYLDIATQTLGKDWHLPTQKDLRELTEECVWEYCILNDNKGYRIIGKNGNSIFLPIEGEFFYEPHDVQSKHGPAYVLYWSSELQSSAEPYGLQISQYEYKIRKGIELSYWNYIRPVKIKFFDE